jgi:hypothetical protein
MTIPPKIKTEADLRDLIEQTQLQRIQEGEALQAYARDTLESLKPANLIRSTLSDITKSQELKDGIITSTVALAAGYFIKTILQGRSDNNFRKLVGSAAQMTVTTMIANHPEKVKAAGKKVFDLVGTVVDGE